LPHFEQRIRSASSLRVIDQPTRRARASGSALSLLIDKHAGIAAYNVADVYALRDDAKETFAWLDRAWSNRDLGIAVLLFDPFILRHKDDTRFAGFCRKLGLPVPGKVRQQT
jgi:hypothetical protein